jgi:HK97 family phage major capsid protein
MVTLEEIQKAIQDVTDRLKAMPEAPTDEKIQEIAKKLFDQCMADPETARKMKFAAATEPDEILKGTKYGIMGMKASDVAWLHDLQTSLIGQKRVEGGGVYDGPSETLTKIAEAIGVTKAMDSAESGYGSQLIGAQYAGTLWQAARTESRLFPLINSFEMQHPTAYLPVEVDFPELLFVAESTTYNASNYDTVKTGSNRVTVTAKKFVTHQTWSGEMEEDSIIPFLPFLQRQAGIGLGYYLDSLILNGDTTNAGTGNINLDDADPADTKHYLAADGIRHAFLVDVTGNGVDAGGAATYDLISALRKKCVDTTYKHDWSHPNNPNDFVYVTDPQTAEALALLDEIKTVDKYGAQATVLTGELMKIGRNPLIASIAMSLTEADGKVSTTGGNNVKGQVAAFNRNGLNWGWRRQVKLETERLPGSDQTRLVYSLRGGLGRFSPTGAASGIKWAAGLYNITI